MFFKCNFKQTHLYSADIIGTAFIHSRPWKALLYFSPDQKELSPVPFHTEGIQDINDLLGRMQGAQVGIWRGSHTIFSRRGTMLVGPASFGHESLRGREVRFPIGGSGHVE